MSYSPASIQLKRLQTSVGLVSYIFLDLPFSNLATKTLNPMLSLVTGLLGELDTQDKMAITN